MLVEDRQHIQQGTHPTGLKKRLSTMRVKEFCHDLRIQRREKFLSMKVAWKKVHRRGRTWVALMGGNAWRRGNGVGS